MNPISFQVKMLNNHLNNPQAKNKSALVPPFAKGGLGGIFLPPDSNSISSVTLRWLPRSLLAVLNALSSSLARRRLVSPSKWNWNEAIISTDAVFLSAPAARCFPCCKSHVGASGGAMWRGWIPSGGVGVAASLAELVSICTRPLISVAVLA